jgi:hypothetical protein
MGAYVMDIVGPTMRQRDAKRKDSPAADPLQQIG